MRQRRGGWTLIELMMAVSIVGMLASMALPQFTHAVRRTRLAEQDVVMTGIEKSVKVRVENEELGWGTWTTSWNPVQAASPFDPKAAGWSVLQVGLDGKLNYSYKVDLTVAAQPSFTVTAREQYQGILSYRTRSWQLCSTWTLLSDSRDGVPLFPPLSPCSAFNSSGPAVAATTPVSTPPAATTPAVTPTAVAAAAAPAPSASTGTAALPVGSAAVVAVAASSGDEKPGDAKLEPEEAAAGKEEASKEDCGDRGNSEEAKEAAEEAKEARDLDKEALAAKEAEAEKAEEAAEAAKEAAEEKAEAEAKAAEAAKEAAEEAAEAAKEAADKAAEAAKAAAKAVRKK